MILSEKKSDNLGTISSTLCLIHCMASPLIFVVHTSVHTSLNTAPAWWKFIDYFFLVVSFLAVYRSAQTTAKKWMKYSLWTAFSFLSIIIINEKIALFHLNENIIFMPTIALICLHQYNKKYCQCNTTKCCAVGK